MYKGYMFDDNNNNRTRLLWPESECTDDDQNWDWPGTLECEKTGV